MEDSLVSNEVGQSQVVNEKNVADYQKVEVGTMSRQQHYRNLTILLDLSDLFEGLYINTNFFIQTFQCLVQGPGHGPHHWDFDLGNQVIDQLFSLISNHSLRLLRCKAQVLDSLLYFVLNSFQNSARGKDFCSDLAHGSDGHVGVESPF